MGRRIEIELTSARDDGSWTWRAAGARQPKGVLDPKILGAAPHVGDVYRVEADFDLEGIVVTAVIPSRERSSSAERIELARPSSEGGVTASLVRPVDRPRRERPNGDRARRTEGSRPRRTDRRSGAPAESNGARRPAREEKRPAGERPTAAATGREKPRARPARFIPGTAHRDALLAQLPAEQRPIADQLTSGGLSGVRRAIAQEQAEAKAAGRPSVHGDAIVELAEQLLPSVKEAMWLDRAEAAAKQLETISLRDLRITVTGASPKDDAGRELLRTLRVALEERVTKLRSSWESDIGHALDEGRVLHALRLSARPPEPTARFPVALVERLASATSAALTESTPKERYLALLEAAAASPVRLAVKPEGFPEDPDGSLKKAAAAHAGRIPALARLLGLALPPPPRPLAAPARTRPPRSGRPATPPRNVPTSRAPQREKATTDERSVTGQTKAEEAAPAVDEPAVSVATDEQSGTAQTNAEEAAPAVDEPAVSVATDEQSGTAQTNAEEAAPAVDEPGEAASADEEAVAAPTESEEMAPSVDEPGEAAAEVASETASEAPVEAKTPEADAPAS